MRRVIPKFKKHTYFHKKKKTSLVLGSKVKNFFSPRQKKKISAEGFANDARGYVTIMLLMVCSVGPSIYRGKAHFRATQHYIRETEEQK